MIRLTQSLSHWLWTYHRDKLVAVKMGHTELITDEMYSAYAKWCATDEGKKYLEGGEFYKESTV